MSLQTSDQAAIEWANKLRAGNIKRKDIQLLSNEVDCDGMVYFKVFGIEYLSSAYMGGYTTDDYFNEYDYPKPTAAEKKDCCIAEVSMTCDEQYSDTNPKLESLADQYSNAAA